MINYAPNSDRLGAVLMIQNFSPGSTVGMPLRASASSKEPPPGRTEDQIIQLFDELRAPVLRYLVSLGLLATEGEEIVQEVFLTLFRQSPRKAEGEHVRAWIFRVARNLALRCHRSRRRKPEDLFGLDFLPHQDPIDPQPTPEEQALNSDRRHRLTTAFNSFPDQVQQTLYLRAEGLRYREIAELLGVSSTTVARTVSQSLEKLQKVYES